MADDAVAGVAKNSDDDDDDDDDDVNQTCE